MNNDDCMPPGALNRRQAAALLAAFGVTDEALAQDPAVADPRSYRVVIDNERVRVLEYKSRPGLGICGQGMHYHPAHVTISLTGARIKHNEGGKVGVDEIPPGAVLYAGAQTHSAEVIGGLGTRTYMIELKGVDWKPSTG
jgi:beta-alanine degradation protein BauB